MILGGPPLSDRHRRALDVAAVGTAAWVGLLYVLGAASVGRGVPGLAIGSVLRGAGLLSVLLGGWFLLRPLWLALADPPAQLHRALRGNHVDPLAVEPVSGFRILQEHQPPLLCPRPGTGIGAQRQEEPSPPRS